MRTRSPTNSVASSETAAVFARSARWSAPSCSRSASRASRPPSTTSRVSPSQRSTRSHAPAPRSSTESTQRSPVAAPKHSTVSPAIGTSRQPAAARTGRSVPPSRMHGVPSGPASSNAVQQRSGSAAGDGVSVSVGRVPRAAAVRRRAEWWAVVFMAGVPLRGNRWKGRKPVPAAGQTGTGRQSSDCASWGSVSSARARSSICASSVMARCRQARTRVAPRRSARCRRAWRRSA